MPRVTTILKLLPVVLALVAVGMWQRVDYVTHRRQHLEDHRSHGQALLGVFEVTAFRECRGGRYEPAELAAAFEETRASLGAEWVSLAVAGGTTLTSAGQLPEVVEAHLRLDRSFDPPRPRRAGAGRGRGLAGDLVDLPAGSMVLSLVIPGDRLEVRLAGDRRRAIVTGAALAAAILLVAAFFRSRTRSLRLRADLETSQVKLRSLEYLRRLGAGLVHETRNPLGVVRGFAERLTREPLEPARLQETAQAILEETDRTVSRLDEFLLLSRPAELHRQRLRVCELFQELVTLLGPDIEECGARVEVDCENQEIEADRDQLRRLFLNLMLNAIAALDTGQLIRLSCESRNGHMWFTVADDGRGVPEELRETLFEPYVSGRPGGTGLGLAIARRIALDHGFELFHETSEPRGTRMVLRVPLP